MSGQGMDRGSHRHDSLFMLGASFLSVDLNAASRTTIAPAGDCTPALLLMATIALLAPAAVAELDPANGEAMAQKLSAGLAVLLISAYATRPVVFAQDTHEECSQARNTAEKDGAGWPIGLAGGTLPPGYRAGRSGERDIRGLGAKGRETLGLSPAFVGFIIVALVGAAAEMAVAFSAARRPRLDMSVSIAPRKRVPNRPCLLHRCWCS